MPIMPINHHNEFTTGNKQTPSPARFIYPANLVNGEIEAFMKKRNQDSQDSSLPALAALETCSTTSTEDDRSDRFSSTSSVVSSMDGSGGSTVELESMLDRESTAAAAMAANERKGYRSRTTATSSSNSGTAPSQQQQQRASGIHKNKTNTEDDDDHPILGSFLNFFGCGTTNTTPTRSNFEETKASETLERYWKDTVNFTTGANQNDLLNTEALIRPLAAVVALGQSVSSPSSTDSKARTTTTLSNQSNPDFAEAFAKGELVGYFFRCLASQSNTSNQEHHELDAGFVSPKTLKSFYRPLDPCEMPAEQKQLHSREFLRRCRLRHRYHMMTRKARLDVMKNPHEDSFPTDLEVPTTKPAFTTSLSAPTLTSG